MLRWRRGKMANEFAEVEDPSMKGVEKLGFKGKNSSTAETTREKQRWERLSQRNVGAGVGRGGWNCVRRNNMPFWLL